VPACPEPRRIKVHGARQEDLEGATTAAADPASASLVRVDVQPIGRRVEMKRGATVLAAIRAGGLESVAV